ncbi:retrotransposon protein, putative, ty1-copia subclass [Tanacetum coccineum]
MSTLAGNNYILRSFFEKEKLTGPNFIDWYRQLQIILSAKDKENYLEHLIPAAPVAAPGQKVPPQALAAHAAWVNGSKEIAEQELLQTIKEFHACKQEEGQSVSSYVLNMKSYIDNLEHLGQPVSLLLAKNQKKKPHKAAKGNQGKGKAKMGYAPMQGSSYAPKPKNPPPPKKENPAKDVICLRGNRKLKLGALSLYVGDGHRASVEAIEEYHLCLPSGLVLILHSCHYAPSITRGIILVSRLYKDGFINRFENDNIISVSRNNLVYFCAIPNDDIYEIDLSSFNTNDSSMYAISNKRAKLNLDSTFLWHCRLGHISKKRIKKLQHDRLLISTDIKSFEKCVSCMSGKMARKPYSHQVERAKDLLGPIHTDEVENQLGKTIKSLRSDHGGEYMSQEFLDHLKEHRIIAHRTPPYTPQHNGVSERINRTLLNMVRSMMSQITLLKSFWDYAFESVARILNMVVLLKRYPKETMGYSFYYPPENKVFIAWNAEFFENSLITQEASMSLEDLEIIQDEDTHPSIDTSLNHKEDDQHELGDLGEPANYKAALLDPESKKWLDAMNVKMQSMKHNDVWDLVDLPPNGKTVGSKWLFKKKTDMDGAVHTFKARLVAKGFTQTYRVDYEEAFSPVVDIRAIRILIVIVAL